MRLNYSQPSEYLNDEHVIGFSKYLLDTIVGKKSFSCDLKRVNGKVYSLDVFKNGLNGYFWAGATYKETQKILKELQSEIQKAISEKNEKLCLLTSLSILDWGQVYRECVNWLVELAKNNEVVSSIDHSTKIIEGSAIIKQDEFLALFDRGGKYRCNSGTTKIFALASDKSIIYDGRVACALGMLILDYLAENKLSYIPESLLFLMDADSKRNPSTKAMKFPSKSNLEYNLINQAVSNYKINLILQSIEHDVNESGVFKKLISSETETLRAIESVLFMVGYKVHSDKFTSHNKYF